MAKELMQPASLSHAAKLVYAHHILDLFSTRQQQHNHSVGGSPSANLSNSKQPQPISHCVGDSTEPEPLKLDSEGDSTVLESEEVLEYLMRTHTESMSAEVILCLAPACLRSLSLKGCSHLSAEDVSRVLEK